MLKPLKSRRQQSGAVLYVALIMLILLALIGIVAMQVASLQERMSANYFASNLAFQNAESTLRSAEIDIENDVNSGNVPAINLAPTDCTSVFDAESYTSDVPYVRRVDLCAGGMISSGEDLSNQVGQIYQITAHRSDRAVLASSEAVVNSVFIP